MPRARKKRKTSRRKSLQIRLGKLLLDVVLCFFALTVVPVLVFGVLNPPTTPLMWMRWMESGQQAHMPRSFSDWKSLDSISLHLVKAAIAAEDQKFFTHNGFDWQAVEAAVITNLTTPKTVGASTITMQTARNVFLWQDRSWLRKSLEAYFTFLLEVFWSKERILEVYLNVIEWGDGLFGCEAASRTYFKHSASTLSPVEAAQMVSILPNPRRWSPHNPNNQLSDRQAKILDAMVRIRIPYGNFQTLSFARR